MAKYSAERKLPDRVFHALASATRRRMTEKLARSGPQPMSALARPFRISLPGAKKHIAVLERAGVVTCRKVGRENICAVNPATIEKAAEWFTFMEGFWQSGLKRLERILAEE
jgi:DNA-binding transcriptional ArsR family regulator